MANKIDIARRHFIGSTILGIASSPLVRFLPMDSESAVEQPNIRLPTFAPLRHVKAGALDTAYVELGPMDGIPVLLLHGWPYDIHTYAEVAPLLAAFGYRVIVPYLRGYGATRFIDPKTKRNGQQSAFALDMIALLDGLGIEKTVVAGCDWGARTACILAALWPERFVALVSISGYLIGSQAASSKPLAPKAEHLWWYQYYFATDRGKAGYEANTSEFARLIWQLASPKWAFETATFEKSANALMNPDHVEIVVHNYRWRLGLANGDRQLDAIEAKLATAPPITVPAITMEGDANGAPHPEPSSYAKKFIAHYEHRTSRGGVGHNLPQEAPHDFARAVIDVAQISFKQNRK